MGRLFWKIFFGFWLTLVVMGVIVGVLVHYYNQQRLAALSDLVAGPWAASNVASVASTLEYGGTAAVERLFAQWPGRRPNPVLVVDHSGHDVLNRPVPVAALQRARTLLASPQPHSGVREVAAPDGQVYILFVPRDVFPSLLATRLRERMFGPPHGPRHGLLRVPLLIWLGAALLASLLFSLALAWYLTRPLRHLREATRHLAEGALGTRVMPLMGWRRDEITELGRDFDHMAAHLQALVGAQQRLLHDVSHELRSPLARMQVAVALAHQQPDKTAQVLARIERETGRLDELVEQLLTLSRLEAGVEAAPAEYVDVSALLETLVEDARFEAEAGGPRVVLHCAAGVVVQGRAELLRRAFENVIRNGLKYSPSDTVVEVGCTINIQDNQGAPAGQGRHWCTVSICDRGAGVDEAELAHLFEPFVRATQSAVGSQRAGYGLGLAIARRAIEAHGGRVRAMNRPGGGLCVELGLPVAEAMVDEDAEEAAEEIGGRHGSVEQ